MPPEFGYDEATADSAFAPNIAEYFHPKRPVKSLDEP
jgi:hypothetical protein